MAQGQDATRSQPKTILEAEAAEPASGDARCDGASMLEGPGLQRAEQLRYFSPHWLLMQYFATVKPGYVRHSCKCRQKASSPRVPMRIKQPL